MAIIATNTTVSVESKSTGARTVVDVSALTKANPGVATATSHGLSDGDILYFTVDGGMVELNGQAVRVANATANDFELENIDTTNFSTWSAATGRGFTEITTFHTMANAQSVSMPNPAPEKIDITTLIDTQKQQAYGLPEAPDGSINGLFGPNGAAETEIREATENNEDRVMRIVFGSGQVVLFTALLSGGTGFEASQNQAVTATTNFTPVRKVVFFAS